MVNSAVENGYTGGGRGYTGGGRGYTGVGEDILGVGEDILGVGEDILEVGVRGQHNMECPCDIYGTVGAFLILKRFI